MLRGLGIHSLHTFSQKKKLSLLLLSATLLPPIIAYLTITIAINFFSLTFNFFAYCLPVLGTERIGRYLIITVKIRRASCRERV